jgi:ATPase subunit of ABC transporter with duplicated ATPase domains
MECVKLCCPENCVISPLVSFCRHGKTTLLRHIASRAFAIPPNIDVLCCEQEVVANDTPAVEEVLKADVKRTELLEECNKLQAEQEKGKMKGQERLQQVRQHTRHSRNNLCLSMDPPETI